MDNRIEMLYIHLLCKLLQAYTTPEKAQLVREQYEIIKDQHMFLALSKTAANRDEGQWLQGRVGPKK